MLNAVTVATPLKRSRSAAGVRATRASGPLERVIGRLGACPSFIAPESVHMLTDTVQVGKEACPMYPNSLEFQAEPCAGGNGDSDPGQGKIAQRVHQVLELRRGDCEHS